MNIDGAKTNNQMHGTSTQYRGLSANQDSLLIGMLINKTIEIDDFTWREAKDRNNENLNSSI